MPRQIAYKLCPKPLAGGRRFSISNGARALIWPAAASDSGARMPLKVTLVPGAVGSGTVVALAVRLAPAAA